MIKYSTVFLFGNIYASFEKRGHIALHISVGQLVGPSVTYSFPINNLRTPQPTFL